MSERIGPYEIQRELGRGGMGVVYLATDTRLGRQVAIKALPQELATDPARLERFEREARTLASLNHPNLAGIYGVEEQDGSRYLILEYVEGVSLADVIDRGPLAVDEAIELAAKIASGVEAAHEAGVIHRDLKPANIIVTPEGQIKVLDFGLARSDDGGHSSSGGHDAPTVSRLQHSPTIAGAILGTAAYMSPEQARGRRVDKRTDIWSFGVVLYEMLTGASPFHGETATDSIGAVLHKDLELNRLPSGTPAHVKRVLARCLERDKELRYRDIGDVRIELLSNSADQLVGAGGSTSRAAPMARSFAVVGWLLVLCGVVAWALMPTGEKVEEEPSLALAITPPAGMQWVVGSNIGWPIISPDGSKVVATISSDEGTGLWVRSLDDSKGHLIPGTSDASYPFWSPDSKHLAYFAEKHLYVVDLDGGLPDRIAPALAGRGGNWSTDGRILLTPDPGGAVHIVDASGGTPRPVTELDVQKGENAHYWPQWLPDNEHFLYMIRTESQNEQGVYLGRVTDGLDSSRKRIVSTASSSLFVPEQNGKPAMLLWVQNEELLAREFDWRAGELKGPTSTIASGVRVLDSQLSTLVSASNTGTLVWASSRYGQEQLVWYNRDGSGSQPVGKLRGTIVKLTLSPDGKRVSLGVVDEGQSALWTFDPETEISHQITSLSGYSERPFWSPDSSRMIFSWSGNDAPMVISASGAGGAKPILESVSDNFGTVLGWVPNDWVIYVKRNLSDTVKTNVMALKFGAAESEAQLLWDTSGLDFNRMTFSTTGKFLAAQQIVRGESRIIVRTLEVDENSIRLGDTQALIPVSDAVAFTISQDESEIVVVAKGERTYAVPVEIPEGGGLRIGQPKLLDVRLPVNSNSYFITDPAGERFLVAADPDGPNQSFEVLTNWRSRVESK